MTCRIVFSILYILFFYVIANGQWHEINTFESPTGGFIKNIVFLDGKDGFFRGGTRSIMRTKDYGISWDTVLWVPKYLSGIQFISDSIGFASFINNSPEIISKTTDRGSTWIPVESNHNFNTNQISHFVNDTLGFVVTYEPNKWYIYRTRDGGLNWDKAIAGIAGGGIEGMAFFNTQRGFAAGCGSCSHVTTTNGGDVWKLMPFSGNYFFSFPDSLRGYTGGSDYIWRTDDGGENWVIVNDYDPILSLDCPSRDTCYGGGLYGIHKTTDGGLNWTYTHMPALNFKTISCPSNDTCYTASVTGNRLFRTFNGGEGGFVSSTNNLNEWIPQIHIFPNPSTDLLSWQSSYPFTPDRLAILDLHGRVIKEIDAAIKNIDISDLVSGLYLFKAWFHNGHTEVLRFVKQ